MRRGLFIALAMLGLSSTPAQAFGPMMLLMMPMMMGGHQHGGDSGHHGATAGSTPAPHDQAQPKQAAPASAEQMHPQPQASSPQRHSSDTGQNVTENDR